MNASDVLASVAKRSELTSPNPPKLPSPEMESDELFGQNMAHLVKEIPDAMCKEMAKLECQQIIFKCRFQSQHWQMPERHNHFGPATAPSSIPPRYPYQQSQQITSPYLPSQQILAPCV